MTVVPQIDRNPRLIVLCQTPPGKIALTAAAALVLFVLGRADWLPVAIALAALAFFPERRRLLLTLTAVYWLALYGIGPKWPFLREIAASSGIASSTTAAAIASASFLAIFAAAMGLLAYVRRHRNSFPARRPVTVLLAFHFAALVAAGTLPLHGPVRLALWSVVAVFTIYRWSFAYALMDVSAKSGEGLFRQIATFFPFWQGVARSATPYPKAAAYMRKIEARTPKELSIVRLKGLKLLIWAFVLQVLLRVFLQVVHITFGAPTLEAALQSTAAGKLTTLPMAWAAVLTHYVEAMLRMAVYGHVIIGICRMAGFNALRNTYRPLQATTLVEFWNRYYYYFKELLVEFFFFPTYLRYFKKYPRLRTFAATFAAAGIGNMLYHFEIENVARVGLWRQFAGFQVYAFYATILAVGIAISQARLKRITAPPSLTFPRRLRATAGVIAFFCLLDIFDYGASECHPLRTHLAFLFSLFS